MADTVNQEIRDEAIRHLIDLHRYTNSVVNDIMKVLATADDDLLTTLATALEKADAAGMATEFNMRRLDQLLDNTRALLVETYASAHEDLQAELRDFIKYEMDYQVNTVDAITPTALEITTPNLDQAYAASEAEPFKGRLLSEWFDSLGVGAGQRLRDTIAQGFLQGKTVGELMSEVRGTKAQGYADGILAIDRRNTEAVVRTAVSHTAAVARDQFIQANSDIISEVQWVSTLDSRTTEECQIRDGLLYTVDGEPIDSDVPWLDGPGQLHWNCRSTSIPVLMSARELGLQLPPQERAAMDGTAPAAETYGEWLTKQSPAVQDKVLGPTRAERLRNGTETFRQFFNNKGEFLTLDQLRAQDD